METTETGTPHHRYDDLVARYIASTQAALDDGNMALAAGYLAEAERYQSLAKSARKAVA